MASIITIVDNQELFSSPSLLDICTQYCTSHSKLLLFAPLKNTKKDLYSNRAPKVVRDDLILPKKIWEELLKHYQRDSLNYVPLVKGINEKVSGGLHSIDLSNCSILKDDDLRLAMQSYPTSLGIHNCPLLTKKAVDVITEFGEKLECLNIGNSSHIIPTDINIWMAAKKAEADKPKSFISSIRDCLRKDKKGKNADVPTHYYWWELGLFLTPKLRKLIIWELQVVQIQRVKKRYVRDLLNALPTEDEEEKYFTMVDFWSYLTRQFIGTLEYLDLSSCHECSNLAFLQEARDLKVLHLHNVLHDYNEATFKVFQSLGKIKYLDVSQYDELACIFANPDVILQNLVQSLPDLTGLDISGTNLAGFEPENPHPKQCRIKGLSSRMKNPLSFLGLLITHHNASLRQNIPAGVISGGGTILQLHVSLQRYVERRGMCQKVIRILYHKLTCSLDGEEFIPYQSFLDLLCKVMTIHIREKHMQITTTATVFILLHRIYLELDDERNHLGDLRKERLFKAVLRVMRIHTSETCLLRNAVMILMVLSNHLTFKDSMARKLSVALLSTLTPVIKANEAESRDDFYANAVAQLINTLLEGGDEVLKELQSPCVIQGLHDAIEVLLPKPRLFVHTPMYWAILTQILNQSKDERHYEIFMSLSVKYIKLCGDYKKNLQTIEMTEEELDEAQVPVLALLINIYMYASPESKIKWIELINGNVEEFLKILEESSLKTSSGARKTTIYLTSGLLMLCYGTKTQVFEDKSQEDESKRREILTKGFTTLFNLDLNSSLSDITFSDLRLEYLYEILESDFAPEVSFWVLKTLSKVMEAHPETMKIMEDERLLLVLDRLRQKQAFGEVQIQIQALCDGLVAEIKSRKEIGTPRLIK